MQEIQWYTKWILFVKMRNLLRNVKKRDLNVETTLMVRVGSLRKGKRDELTRRLQFKLQ